MSRTLHGVYRNGRIELVEEPADKLNEGPVLITFLEPGEVDLSSRGIDEEHAADLRARLNRFVEDWESPEMRNYDDYDTAKSNLQKR
jgi:hypothetical protein